MGLRINTNVAALNSARILSRSTQSLNDNLERLASGLRINRAKDDAAGLAIAEGFRSVVRGTQVAQRNAQDGVSLVQTAEGALSETTNILQRIRELALQAANGTQSTENRQALDNEVQQLLSQINDIALNTEFNGIRILSSSQSVTLQAGAQQGQTLVIAVQGAKTNDLGINTVRVSSIAQAVGAISTIDAAIRSVSTLRSNLGAYQNRLEFTINTLSIQEENSAASESAIRDADIARETIAFTRNQILVTAGTSVLAQANIVPQTARGDVTPEPRRRSTGLRRTRASGCRPALWETTNGSSKRVGARARRPCCVGGGSDSFSRRARNRA
jgi:flagellin